jgi:hypothetical protein
MTSYPVEFHRRLEQKWASLIDQILTLTGSATPPRDPNDDDDYEDKDKTKTKTKTKTKRTRIGPMNPRSCANGRRLVVLYADEACRSRDAGADRQV